MLEFFVCRAASFKFVCTFMVVGRKEKITLLIIAKVGSFNLVLYNLLSVLPQLIGTLMRTKDPCKPFACEIQKCLKGEL